MGNLGAWDAHYAGLITEEPYGGDESYGAAAEWTAGCSLVEDWGCGKGWLRRFVEPERYRGLDGSCSPFADEVVDLTTYRSSAPGIVLRHVLEHEHDWQAVLDNAVASFTERLFIAIFTPLQDETRVLQTEPDYGDVPVIGFQLADIVYRIIPPPRPDAHFLDVTHVPIGSTVRAEVTTIPSPGTFYSEETLIRVQR